MDIIDTHCHLTDLSEVDLQRQLHDASTSGVSRVICVGASRGKISSTQALRIAEANPQVWCSIGIHPHDAGDYTALDELEELASHNKVVAIGETGLDYFREWSPFDKQKELFINTIAVAKNLGKPLIIHCREAADDTFKILREQGASDVGGVFHCFSESAVFADSLAEINFLVSFTGTVTFKKAEALREVVRQVPLERIMLETDAPYMAPEPFRGQPSEPKHVRQVCDKIAQVKDIDVHIVAQQTTWNAERLFGL